LETKTNALIEAKRALIEPEHPDLSIVHPCELLACSSYYYALVQQSEENMQLMRLLDEQYTRTQFYGTHKMTAWLHTQSYPMDRKRMRRLLRLMGLEAIYPKPRTSVLGTVEQRYPYSLRNMSIERCNQVWSCDVRRFGIHGIPAESRRG
jgi:putative transposase